jgi:hypothetical protein
MATGPMKPVVQLTPGTKISAKFLIDPVKVRYWMYAKDCPSNFAPIQAGSVLEIFEVNKSVPVWVKAYLPHTHDTMYLKISGEELAGNFHLAL